MKRHFLDSNIFIRLVTKEIHEQFEKAKEIFEDIEEERITAYVSILVVNEVIWILENYYKMRRSDYIPQLLNLLNLKNLHILEAKKQLIISCLKTMQERNFDFTDIYLSNISDKETLLSFDKDFNKLFDSN